MNKRMRGFTIVEVFITVVVVGILASIIAVNWSGTTLNAEEKTREQDVRQWAAAFDLYKSRFLAYPVLPTGDGSGNAVKLCLGTFSDAPYNGECARYGAGGSRAINAADSATLLTQIAKVGSVPKNTGPAVDKTFVGPYVYMEQSTDSGTGAVTVEASFIGFFKRPCSTVKDFSDATTDATNPSGKLYPAISSILAGYSGSVYICYLPSSFTYNPS